MSHNNPQYFFSSPDETAIAALCTPRGSGAIALIRICGHKAPEIVDQIAVISQNQTLNTAPSHTIHYGKIVDKERNLVDRVLFLLMKAPKTFTGQDTVEISCHNNPFVIDKILQLLFDNGARPAREGEFCKRAVLNEKLDLTQAEAVNELIHANSPWILQKSLSQLEGTLSNWMHTLEQQVLHALTLCNASFEFIEEDNIEFGEQIHDILRKLCDHISELQSHYQRQNLIRQGVRIAIIGSVNAGKSSLLNLLLGSKRAIVSDQPGTTRDTIEASLMIDGLYWTIIDTAGIRQTNNSIEKEGIIRSLQEAHRADIVLLVYDGSHPLHDQEAIAYQDLISKYAQKILAVRTKKDLVQQPSHPPTDNIDLVTSIEQPETAQQLITLIQQRVIKLIGQHNAAFLLNDRQLKTLNTLKQHLVQSQSLLLTKPIAYELVSHHLQDALVCISEFTGKTISEQTMDAVFRTFCVGK